MRVKLRIFTKGKRFFRVSQQLLFMTVGCTSNHHLHHSCTGLFNANSSFIHFLRLVLKKEKNSACLKLLCVPHVISRWTLLLWHNTSK